MDGKLNKWYETFKSFDGTEISIKIYQPRAEGKDRAALVFVHGGGFKTCSVETHDFVPSYLAANAGVVAFSVEYRLAPEYRFPIGLKDCYEAVKWVKAQAQRLPYMVVLGDKEIENGTISVRSRHEGDQGAWPVDKLVDILKDAAL